jgi:hypothetical protein
MNNGVFWDVTPCGLVFLRIVRRLLVTDSVVPSSPILVTLMKEALSSSETRFLQEPHGVTSQKTPFFKSKKYLYATLNRNQSYSFGEEAFGQKRYHDYIFILSILFKIMKQGKRLT